MASESKKKSVRILYGEGEKLVGQTVLVEGWIRTARASKAVAFIELNDGSFFKNLQIVYDPTAFADLPNLTTGSAISVEGELVESPKDGQPFELQAARIDVSGIADADYPLQKKRHSFEYLRTIAHLRNRGNTFSAVFRMRSLISHAIHCFFQERDFVYVHAPILTASDCEGAGDMFRVSTFDLEQPLRGDDGKIDYAANLLGRDAYLTVSGQLELETYCMGFNNVYTFGPTFRAENSNTARHGCEFWMIEPEIAFAELGEVMDLAEDMLKFVVRYALEKAPEELDFFNRFIDKGLLERLTKLVDSNFVRCSYTEAVEILLASGQQWEFPVEWGADLQSEHERFLTEQHFGGPVFVYDYPKAIKSFYMRANEDGKTVAACDLLVPGPGELLGGSQREERYDELKERMLEKGMDLAEYEWYLDLRRFGTTKHGGFGLGLERLIMYVTGMENFRDVIPFPRTPGHVEF
jgi:asparaginyl-tRNA synthetase